MKILNLTLILSTLFIFSSCEKNSTLAKDIDVQIEVKLQGQQGQNLLTTPTTLNQENINLYYILNGVESLYYKSNLDRPKGFIIIKDENGAEILQILPNIERSEEFPVTIIKAGNLNPDTIKCQITRRGSLVQCSKFWVNNVLKYDITNRTKRSITIIK